MPRDWTDTYSFTRGAVAARDRGYLVLVEDARAKEKAPHGVCAQWNAGRWREAGIVGWTVRGVCVCGPPDEQMVAVGEPGIALVYDGRDRHEERIGPGGGIPTTPGALCCVRAIGGRAYAAGMGRQVYRRDGRDRWTPIDQGMRRGEGERSVVGFQGIDGFSEREIYAVGWKGEIWLRDGDAWERIDSPTNLILSNVCCGGDGQVYACGRMGLLLRGRGQRWEGVVHEDTIEDFWGLAWFGDRLYVASTRAVYTLAGDHLTRVDFGEDLPATCYHLSATADVLWSIGAKDVMAFDGQAWTRID